MFPITKAFWTSIFSWTTLDIIMTVISVLGVTVWVGLFFTLIVILVEKINARHR